MSGWDRHRLASALGSVAGGVLVLGACATAQTPSRDASSTVPTADTGTAAVTLTDAGCELTAPSEVPAGPLHLTMSSETTGRFDVDLWRLNDGHAYQELADHIAEEMRRIDAEEAPLGHPAFATLVAEASADQGATAVLEAQLEPGSYGLACIHFPTAELPAGLWAAGPIVIRD